MSGFVEVVRAAGQVHEAAVTCSDGQPVCPSVPAGGPGFGRPLGYGSPPGGGPAPGGWGSAPPGMPPPPPTPPGQTASGQTPPGQSPSAGTTESTMEQMDIPSFGEMMSGSAGSGPPAGWFPAPGGPEGRLRYRDGTVWTEHYH